MYFKLLTTKVGAILKSKPAEPSKKEPPFKAPGTAANAGSPGQKKT